MILITSLTRVENVKTCRTYLRKTSRLEVSDRPSHFHYGSLWGHSRVTHSSVAAMLLPGSLWRKINGLGYTVANISTSLVWLVRTNEVCDTILGGCEWGKAASYLLIAQITYIAAAIFYRCLPDPKEVRAERGRAKEEHNATKNEDSSANRGVGVAAAGGSDGNSQLQADLDRANQRIQSLEQENEATKKKLATATATTSAAAGVEAAQLKKANEKNAALEKELDAARKEIETANSASSANGKDTTQTVQSLETELANLKEEHDKTKKALAVATAATGTVASAEAAKVKTLTAENEKYKEQMQQATVVHDKAAALHQEEINELAAAHEKTKKALAIGTANTATAAAKEGQLQEQVAKLTEENAKYQEELVTLKESQAKNTSDVEDITEELEKNKKALAIATAATGAAATAEAVEIRRLKDELEQFEQEKLAIQNVGEEQKAQIQSLQSDVENLTKELEKTENALATATAATGAAATAEAVEIRRLKDELEQVEQEKLAIQSVGEEEKAQTQSLYSKVQELEEENAKAMANLTAEGGFEVVDKDHVTDDPPAAVGDENEFAMLRQENHLLRAELDMVKSEYTQKLIVLEETETHIREDLAHKIDKLHDKNEKRKEALAAATSHLNQDSVKLHKLRKENDALQDRIQELEEENEKQKLALVRQIY